MSCVVGMFWFLSGVVGVWVCFGVRVLRCVRARACVCACVSRCVFIGHIIENASQTKYVLITEQNKTKVKSCCNLGLIVITSCPPPPFFFLNLGGGVLAAPIYQQGPLS